MSQQASRTEGARHTCERSWLLPWPCPAAENQTSAQQHQAISQSRCRHGRHLADEEALANPNTIRLHHQKGQYARPTMQNLQKQGKPLTGFSNGRRGDDDASRRPPSAGRCSGARRAATEKTRVSADMAAHSAHKRRGKVHRRMQTQRQLRRRCGVRSGGAEGRTMVRTDSTSMAERAFGCGLQGGH